MTPNEIERPEQRNQPSPHTVPEHEVVLTETEARSAVPVNRVRYILGISLSLSIVALAIVYFVYAA